MSFKFFQRKSHFIKVESRHQFFTSFLLTIQKLQKEDLAAFRLVSILGILDGSFIGESLAKEFCKDAWEYTKIKRLLLDYSMIKSNERVSELEMEVLPIT